MLSSRFKFGVTFAPVVAGEENGRSHCHRGRGGDDEDDEDDDCCIGDDADGGAGSGGGPLFVTIDETARSLMFLSIALTISWNDNFCPSAVRMLLSTAAINLGRRSELPNAERMVSTNLAILMIGTQVSTSHGRRS